jgi:predicted transcriptional regulator YheO
LWIAEPVIGMTQKQKLFEALKPLIHGIAKAIGPDCEIVLHDFAEVEKSIIAIENGHLTGRKVGDGLDELSFRMLRQENPPDLFHYRGRTASGRVLRSSSILLREKSGKPFGAVGINVDITTLLIAQDVLGAMTSIAEESVQEAFEKNVEEVLERYIQEAQKAIGKKASLMDKEDRLKFLRILDDRGAFLIRYSADRVAAFLDVSRYTVYSYLEESRQLASKSER